MRVSNSERPYNDEHEKVWLFQGLQGRRFSRISKIEVIRIKSYIQTKLSLSMFRCHWIWIFGNLDVEWIDEVMWILRLWRFGTLSVNGFIVNSMTELKFEFVSQVTLLWWAITDPHKLKVMLAYDAEKYLKIENGRESEHQGARCFDFSVLKTGSARVRNICPTNYKPKKIFLKL